MARWRFYQGLRAEWRWYHFDDSGNVVTQSDTAFAELSGAMANAEAAGFNGDSYQVLARQSGSLIHDAAAEKGILETLPLGIAALQQSSS